jgi:hypothetical protein
LEFQAEITSNREVTSGFSWEARMMFYSIACC